VKAQDSGDAGTAGKAQAGQTSQGLFPPGREPNSRSGAVTTVTLRSRLPPRSAGVCAPAVTDFATVRNRSAHTTEDAQPRSQTVMTYREPSPQTWKACWRQPSGVRISHPALSAATSGSRGAASRYGQRPWLIFPRAQIPLDDLAVSRWHASGRAMPGPRKTAFTPPGLLARLQETRRKRIDPVHVTVVGEA
jgi:hypothetical protein